MQISSASFAYPDLSAEKRAVLARRLRPETTVRGVFVLTTCLRVEILVDGDVDVLAHALEQLFDQPPDIADATLRCDADAAVHLFRVVAGLESPIVGEREILAQFRDALQHFQEVEAVSGLFSKLLQESIPAGRRARESLPTSPHASLAAVAAQMIGGADRVAVLGSGVMSAAVVQALKELPGPPRVTVVARAPERVREPNIDVWPFERAVDALRNFPAVISVTSARHQPVSDAGLTAALSERRERGILIDMAMPPDFRIPEDSALTYVNIDQLARKAGPRPRLDDADESVRSAALHAYRRFSNHQRVGPLITALVDHTDQIVDGATEHFAKRLNGVDDAAVLRQAAHNVARTLIAAPVSFVKASKGTTEDLQIVAEIFGIVDEDPPGRV